MRTEINIYYPTCLISSKVHLIVLCIIIIMLMTGCDPKKSPFFSPDFNADNNSDDMIPTTEMIVGDWDITYIRQAFTCSGTQPEFTVGATVLSTNPTSLIYQFPDAPAGIGGSYNPSTGEFNGTTGDVDRGDGTTVSETWNTSISYSNDPFSVTLNGESEVLLTDEDGNTLCFVDYDIEGMKL